MADSLIYQVSSRSDMMEEPFSRKDVVYIIDQNNSSYSGGQILLETSQLANSGRWASYSEAYLTIPLVLGWRTNINSLAAASVSPFLLGLKNGYHQLIDSISVDLNGTNVCQLTPYSNFFVSYKMMTSWSADDVAKYGASCNFFPDDVNSAVYVVDGATGLSGNGVANNLLTLPALTSYQAAQSAYIPFLENTGFRKRIYNLNYVGSGGIAALLSSGVGGGARAVGMNFWQTAGAAENLVAYSSVIAKIRLKDIHDFFSQVPLLKGAFFKFTFNLNTAYAFVQKTGNANAGTIVVASASDIVQTAGRTNPLMVASGQASNPFNQFAAQVLTIGCGVGSLSLPASATGPSGSPTTQTVNHATMSSCRLYVPLYTMQPSYEDQYISMNPTKSIIYRDIYSYRIPNVAASSSINQLLTNGLVAPKSLVVIPILNGSAGNNANQAFDPIQSPFASEPATTSFGAALTTFNVQLSGINVFQSNQLYDYEAFMNELSRINAVNGGQTTGLLSGLIDEYKFSTMYRYYVCDLSRGYSSEDMVPKSVQLSCQNVCAKILDLYCFIEYERKISVDLRTGQVVQV